MAKPKVFCCNCIYFYFSMIGLKHKCDHPKNYTEEKEPDSWLAPGVVNKIYVREPSDINFKNGCKWFKKKHPKSNYKSKGK